MKRRDSWLGAAIALAPLLAAPSARAWCRTTTDPTTPATPSTCITTGTPLFWGTRCATFTLDAQAGGGLDLATVRTAATAAFDTWSAVTCGSTPVFSVVESATTVDCQRAEYSSNDGNSNTIAFISDFSARMYPDAIAVTIVWHNQDTGQIYDADMMINTAYGPFVQCNGTCLPSESHFDLQNTITHEAGHFFGLAHSAVVGSTMFYSALPGETSKRTLAQDDLDGLCAAYGSGVVPAECDPTPRHGFDANCNDDGSGRGGCRCDASGESSGPIPMMGSIGLLTLGLMVLRRLRFPAR